MSHRAQQIIDQVVSLLETATGIPSHVQQTLTLGAEDNELPAYAVMVGAEDAEAMDFKSIGSALSLSIVAYAQGDTGKDTLYTLIDMRRQVHIALMANPTLGLSFVWGTQYGGVEAPETVTAARVNMRQAATWVVHYSMNITDPT